MSIIDNNKGGVNLPKGGDLAKNALNSAGSKATDKLQNLAEDKLNDLAAPVMDKINEVKGKVESAKAKLDQAKGTFNKAQNIMGGDKLAGFNPTSGGIVAGAATNYSIVPSEILEKEALLNKLRTYGGKLSDLFGDSHLVSCTVKINGEEVLTESNYELTIKQNTAEHDEFTIQCPADAFGEAQAYPLSQTGAFLGKRMTALFRQFGKVTSSFTGIITNVSSRKQDGYSLITLTGKSPTILLENGFDSQSYEEKTLKDIITTATSEYNGLLEWDIRPLMEESLLYTVQYKESDWEFIKRLATRYGEWIYWDGSKVVFGGYGGKTVELQESQDISRYELKMQLVPQKFTYLSYDAKKAENYTVNSDSVSIEPSVNPFQQKAVKASEDVFAKVPTSLYNQSLLEKGEQELKDAVKRQRQTRQNVFFLEADSDNPELRVGDIVKLKAWMPSHEIFKSGNVPLESYRILSIKHTYDPAEGYKNTFTGVPKDNFTPPYMNEDAIPECEEQSAIVMDNNDPEGLSRIRVQFPWQKVYGGQTPWIRSITPYAGGGKGMHIVPEIGEEVIVSFENGNAEKPVSLGSMFNGKGKSGHGGAGNYVKGLQTPSGSGIQFNDKHGHAMINDSVGDVMKLNGAGTASIYANSTGSITVGKSGESKITMSSSGDITIEGKTSIELKVGETSIKLTEKDIKAMAFENIDAIALKDIAIRSLSGGIDITSPVGKLIILALEYSIQAITTGKVNASTGLNVSGGIITDIKSALVKINT